MAKLKIAISSQVSSQSYIRSGNGEKKRLMYIFIEDKNIELSNLCDKTSYAQSTAKFAKHARITYRTSHIAPQVEVYNIIRISILVLVSFVCLIECVHDCI